MCKGIAVSKGIAIGQAHILDRSNLCVIKHTLNPINIEDEVIRFRNAIELTKKQMQETKIKASKVATKYSILLDTYTLLLEDDIFVKDTINKIRAERINAEWAITETLYKFIKLFNNINDEYLKGKKDDLELVVNGIIKNLLGHSQDSLAEIHKPVILVTNALSPSDTLSIPRDFVLGLATEVGGKTSHVGIFASALGIPSVVGVKNLTNIINTGDQIIIDGIDGNIIINPSKKTLKHYKDKQANYNQYEENLLINIGEPTVTKDNFRVKLMANIETTHEINILKKFGAEGVGLYRTEFLYLGSQSAPTERDLYNNFKTLIQEIAPLPVTIRTLDIGMDKQLHSFKENDEDNPALGLRGIRMSLAYQEQFIVQLRAILRASIYGEVKILYPMITDVEEIIQVNLILDRIKEEMEDENIPFDNDIEIGAMIETPSSAICSDLILKEVDFISIGTNDLIQYTLAVDRINEKVDHLYTPYNPAIIKILKQVLDNASAAKKKVSICGELGGDPMATLLLLGLGNLTEISMDSHSIPRVKKIISQSTIKDAKIFSKKILNLNSTKEINRFIHSNMLKRYPLVFTPPN
jgi:phosphotransferase system enzyme I (PtsI)